MQLSQYEESILSPKSDCVSPSMYSSSPTSSCSAQDQYVNVFVPLGALEPVRDGNFWDKNLEKAADVLEKLHEHQFKQLEMRKIMDLRLLHQQKAATIQSNNMQIDRKLNESLAHVNDEYWKARRQLNVQTQEQRKFGADYYKNSIEQSFSKTSEEQMKVLEHNLKYNSGIVHSQPSTPMNSMTIPTVTRCFQSMP